jgi:hypothetical protein
MTTSVVVKYMARYLVAASGENSAENIPIIPGLHGFVGGANLLQDTTRMRYWLVDIIRFQIC